MRLSPEIHFDVASVISQGQRDYQEDAIVTDFSLGAELGYAVLADGMGGHSSGDVASKIIVTEVFSELKLQSGNQKAFEENVTSILMEAVMAANECVKGHVDTHPETDGMGATLVAPVFIRDQLYWISVGDSPLFLYRDGVLEQLNEDHSMAPQIDYMVDSGLIDADIGREHPDRNCLTSVLIGGEIARIDCPADPVELLNGDILIVASDGLQFLSNEKIESVLVENHAEKCSKIAELLLEKLEDLNDPDQDNISFSIIKMHNSSHLREDEVLQNTMPDTPEVAFSSGRAKDGLAGAARGSGSALRSLQFFRRQAESSDGAT